MTKEGLPVFHLFFPLTQVISKNRGWIVMAAVIFMASAVVFYFMPVSSQPAAEGAVDGQLDQLEDLFSMILGTTPMISVLLVFMNNFLSMAQMLLLGFLAGISPLVTLGLNGALIGIVLALSAGESAALLPLIFLGLLPHGIFELFAFFLCGAIGLKFGFHCIASPLPGKTRSESFRYIWKEAISVLPLVVLLLIIAALIEILITPRLLETIL